MAETDLSILLNEIAGESPLPGQTLLPNGKKTKGRVKIKMEYIGNKLRRYTTFSKRKTGIMKKAQELSVLTGTQVMLLVASETGHVYAFATNKLRPMISSEAGRSLIQSCLSTPDDAVAGMPGGRDEFTFEPPAGSMAAGTARKRKIQETETLCLPTMVSSGSTHSTSPMNVEEYCESDDNDSDTNESPDTVMDGFDESPIPPIADSELLQKTLKDALKAASLQRQHMMNKKPKLAASTTPSPSKSHQPRKSKQHSSNHSSNDMSSFEQLTSLLPLMFPGMSASSHGREDGGSDNEDDDKILYQMPQGVVYAASAADADGGSDLFNNGGNKNSSSSDDNPLASLFPALAFGNLSNMSFQQMLAATALSQLAEAQNLK